MKKYTIKDFLAGKVAVKCVTRSQKESLLKVCKEHGVLWIDGRQADELFPFFDVLSISPFTDRLGQGVSKPTFSDAIVNCSELSFTPHRMIVITSDGDATTAKMFVNGKEVKQVTAKRNPADKANFHIGAQTAFDRLWEKKEKPVKKDDFKVGDRVVCVYSPLNNNVLGEHGRIVAFSCFGNVGVEFDKNVNGHALDGFGVTAATKNGHCWWCSPDHLCREQTTKPGRDA